MGSKSSKAGTKTPSSGDIIIDTKKGAVHISGRDGHGYTNVRTVYTEYYSDGTKKSENVIDIDSEYDSKIPCHLNDLDADQQSKSKLKAPLPDPTFDKTKIDSQMKRTNGVVIHSSDNNLLDNNGMVIELEVDRKRHESEHHFTGMLTIDDQHKALCKYECKQARDNLSTEVAGNNLEANNQPEQYTCVRKASLTAEINEHACEQECGKEIMIAVRELIFGRFHEEDGAILQSTQSPISAVNVSDKLTKVYLNYLISNNSIEAVEECDSLCSTASSTDSSLTARKEFLQGFEKLEFTKNVNDSMIATQPTYLPRYPITNGTSGGNISNNRSETILPCPLDITVSECCQSEMPNIANYEPEEQQYSMVDVCTSAYQPEVKVLSVILLLILVHYKVEYTVKEEDAEQYDALKHQEVSIESDKEYGSFTSIKSEQIVRCQCMPTTNKNNGEPNILKLKNALKDIEFDVPKCIAKCDSVIACPGLNNFFEYLWSCSSITERERMSCEWLRFITFISYNGNGCPMHLARSGFYHAGHNETRCFSCDTSYSDWNATDEVDQTHRRMSPTCPFIVGGIDAAGNIAIDECVQESREEEEGHSLSERQEISVRRSERRWQHPRNRNRLMNDASYDQRTCDGHVINNGEAINGAMYDGSLVRDRHTGPSGNSALSNENIELDSQTRNDRLHTSLVSNLPHGTTATDRNECDARGSGRFLDQNIIRNTIQELSLASIEINGHTSEVEVNRQDSTTPYTMPPRPYIVSNSDDDVNGAAGYSIGIVDTSRNSGIRNEGDSHEAYLEEEVNDSLSPADLVRPFRGNIVRMAAGEILSSDGRTIETINDFIGRARHQDYRTILLRQDSFAAWPTDIKVDIHNMAVSGFYYLGEADFVACFFCGGGLRGWNLGVDPYVEHARWYPSCDYMKRLKGNGFIQQSIGAQQPSDEPISGNPVIAPTQPLQITRQTGEGQLSISAQQPPETSDLPQNAARNQRTSESSGSASPGQRNENADTIEIAQLKHPRYRTMDVRMSSFRSWPNYLNQTPRQMAYAGFFHPGVADFARCFCCGGGLRNWEADDDPMVEHARWYPRCEYINKLKGTHFVQAVLRRHREHVSIFL